MPVRLTDALATELGQLWDDDDPVEIGGFTYVLYEESSETNEMKDVHWDRIYKRNDDKYFVQYCSKRGDYWSGYEHDYGDELHEVKEVEIKVVQWMIAE